MATSPNSKAHQTIGKKIQSFFVLLFSGVIVAIIAGALWVSVDSAIEKLRVSQGLQQIIGIVAMARDAAQNDNRFVGSERKDLLDILERAGRLKTDGVEGGVRTLHNPWRNVVVATLSGDGWLRVESIVPPHICQRFIGSFAKDPRSFGVRQIEVKGYVSSWRQVYTGDTARITEDDIAAACGDTVQADVALNFSLK